MTNAMDGVIEAIARGQHGLFTARQATEAGATEEMIRHRGRTGRWGRVHPGVYALVGAERSATFRVHAAVLAAGPDAVASHTTAAALLGIPGFAVGATPVHVTVCGYTARRRAPARLHRTLRLPPHHRRYAQGVPCTSPARTVLDLCGQLPVTRAERALDNTLARRIVTGPELRQVLRDVGARGRAGSGVLRRLLVPRDDEYAAPESELEARFVEVLRAARLPQPARQVDLGDADGWVGRVDFAYREARIVVECDGALAHTSLLDRRADQERDRRLVAAGWRVLRFTWPDVTTRAPSVVVAVRDALAARRAA